MIKVGIQSGGYVRNGFSFAQGLRKMRAHGYECTDYGSFCNTETPLFAASEAEFERILAEQRRIAEGEGIEISQTHGPWRFPMRDETEEDRAERFEKMAKSYPYVSDTENERELIGLAENINAKV